MGSVRFFLDTDDVIHPSTSPFVLDGQERFLRVVDDSFRKVVGRQNSTKHNFTANILALAWLL